MEIIITYLSNIPTKISIEDYDSSKDKLLFENIHKVLYKERGYNGIILTCGTHMLNNIDIDPSIIKKDKKDKYVAFDYDNASYILCKSPNMINMNDIIIGTFVRGESATYKRFDYSYFFEDKENKT